MLFRKDFRYHLALLKQKQIPISVYTEVFFQLLITFLFSYPSSQGGKRRRYDLAKFLLAVLSVIFFKTCLELHYKVFLKSIVSALIQFKKC